MEKENIFLFLILIFITKFIEDNLPNLKWANIRKAMRAIWSSIKIAGFLTLIVILVYLIKGGKLTIPTRVLIYISIIPATLFIVGLIKRKRETTLDTIDKINLL